jgi:hypothetical protein
MHFIDTAADADANQDADVCFCSDLAYCLAQTANSE